ncbi:MAG: hypothetical protein HBSAPP03_08320 [Phycisphaerae bacterium]|nr:MAG: hypothetical protein HBSAPP03_08320 [Phycisphaerae bacterium]
MPTLVEQATDLVIAREYDKAERLLRPYVTRKQDDAAAAYLLGHALAQQGKPAQAVFFLQRAAAPAGAPANALVEYGVALFDSGRHDEGLAQLAKAARTYPEHAPAHALCAKMLHRGGFFVDAMESCLRALHLMPEQPEVMSIYASCLAGLGRVEQAVEWFRKAAAARPEDIDLRGHVCFALNAANAPSAEVFAEHQAYGRLVASQANMALRLSFDADPERPLRVGFLSPDLREHPVARFIAPVLRGLRRDMFAISVYDAGLEHDAVTADLRRLCPSWRDVASTTDAQLVEIIRRDRIDILIDLAGITGNTRVGVMAWRAAPVQMTYLGYPNTTGVPGVDYRLVDAITDPAGADAFATERLIRLPGCFLCFDAEKQARRHGSESRATQITFGSFNNPTKITDATLALWGGVLRRVPGSRLALKGKGFNDPKCRVAFERRFAAAGLDLSRLTFLAYTPTHAEHLAAYAHVDIALDTFPYGGTTTTCEALSRGVPVVTLAGRTHASRVGASLLTAAGFPGWVARDEGEYATLAADLAADPSALARVRAELPARLSASPLCDTEAFVRNFEHTLRDVWREAARKARAESPARLLARAAAGPVP